MLGYASMGIGVGLGFVLSAYSLSARSIVKRWTLRVVDALRPRPSRFTAIHADAIEWRENQLHRDRTTFFMKPLPHEDERGHVLMLVRYPAGQLNPSHVHSVGHGMYVLRGELVTHRGTFGPDTFVWFPANEVMWHGAGPAEDLVVLFSTGSGLDTRYVARAPG
jgi:quercetin dioxygenase-like cupin family protein